MNLFRSSRSYYKFLIAVISVIAGGCSDDEGVPMTPLDQAYEDQLNWRFIPKDNMITRLGFSSGYAVSFNQNSDKLFIYLEGGGACFNAVTCFGNPGKFDQDDYDEFFPDSRDGQGIFDRDNSLNHFADWNFIYIPYTTGDVHSGNNPSANVPGGATNQVMVGSLNVGIVVDEISGFFEEKELNQIFLTGASAGGYGAIINYDQVAQAFAGINVSAMDDSGPIFFDEELYPECLDNRYETIWNIQFPDDFNSFTSDTYPYRSQRIFEYLSTKYPDAEFGFYSTYADQTMSFFFGFGQDDCADAVAPIPNAVFKEGLFEVADHLEEYANWSYFMREGDSHTILFSSDLFSTEISGLAFHDWMEGLAEGTSQSVME